MLPQLRKLERKHDRELVVVGVHSAKFTAEKSSEAIRQAVRRYDVDHPVINDRDFRVWSEYAVRAWPTLVFIDPQGRVIGRHEGEFPLAAIDRVITDMVAEFDARGLLDRRPLLLQADHAELKAQPLRFPGKVLVDNTARLLYIADTGHHRVVVADLDGSVQRVIGSGEGGLQDGPAEEARFNHPQGLAITEDRLFVADTENHALRCVDLSTGLVTTVAGTGEEGMCPPARGPALGVSINSPWDLVFYQDQLYVAMAGYHQLWTYDLERDLIGPAVGSRAEGLKDGSLAEAELAQPSGLATEEGHLYVACSEASAIRWVDVEGDRVGTLVGLGLFEFGDVDGQGAEVRLQHPLGLAAASGILYIADTYNHKLKRLDPTRAEVHTIFGTGEPGLRDGRAEEAQFSEPGGLAAAEECLFVADTNNHAIRVADLTSGTVHTLDLRGLTAPAAQA